MPILQAMGLTEHEPPAHAHLHLQPEAHRLQQRVSGAQPCNPQQTALALHWYTFCKPSRKVYTHILQAIQDPTAVTLLQFAFCLQKIANCCSRKPRVSLDH